MREAVHSIYDGITVPVDLKNRVKAEMRKELQREAVLKQGDPVGDGKVELFSDRSSKKKNYAGMFAGVTGLAAACLCVYIFASHSQSSIYVTPMKEGAYYAQVELKDGEINFIERGEALSFSANLGVVGAADGQSATAQEEVAKEIAEETGLSTDYAVGEGTITMKRTKGALPQAKEEEYSYISGQKLFVTTVTKDGTELYKAYYEKDDFLYTVTGEGITQKEFIDFIYEKIQ